MGRKKIKIEPLKDKYISKSTFLKRRDGLIKKAIELSILTGCKLMVIAMSDDLKTVDSYASSNFADVVTNYQRVVKDKSYKEHVYSNKDLPIFERNVVIDDEVQ